MNHFYLGLDLGQKRDHTAIAVVEFEEPVMARFDYVSYLRREVCLDPVYRVRYLRRLPLCTSYPEIVTQVRDLTRRPEVRGHSALVVDGTGVGAAVVDLVKDADLDCEVVPVAITGGLGARRDGRWWHVPKRDLIGVVQVLLEQGRLKFARRSQLQGFFIVHLAENMVRHRADLAARLFKEQLDGALDRALKAMATPTVSGEETEIESFFCVG